jgi:hypothetical protein
MRPEGPAPCYQEVGPGGAPYLVPCGSLGLRLRLKFLLLLENFRGIFTQIYFLRLLPKKDRKDFLPKTM